MKQQEEDSNLGLYAALLGGTALAASPFAFKPVRTWSKEHFIDPLSKAYNGIKDTVVGLGQMPGVAQTKGAARTAGKKAVDFMTDPSLAEAGHYALHTAKESLGHAALSGGKAEGIRRLNAHMAQDTNWKGIQKADMEKVAGKLASTFRVAPANLRNISHLGKEERAEFAKLKGTPDLKEGDYDAIVHLADKLKEVHTSKGSYGKSTKELPFTAQDVMNLYLNLIK